MRQLQSIILPQHKRRSTLKVFFIKKAETNKMKETEKNRAEAYHSFNTTKKEYENCLLPLWVYGEGTSKEISETINVPINKVSGRFSKCAEKGLIHVNPVRPSKIADGRSSTNYILTAKGKEVVKEMMSQIKRPEPSPMSKQVFSAVSSVYL
jgi:DNA-binding MarR family transcriptional regulator